MVTPEELGPQASGPDLAASLSHPNPARRKEAARAIGLARQASAASGLLHLLDDREPAVVTTALWALGRLGRAEHLPAIVARLDHHDRKIARAAIWATARIGGEAAARSLAQLLHNLSPDLLTPLLVALDQLPRSQTIATLLPLLHNGDGPTRSRVSQALIRWPGPSAAAVRAHLVLPAAGPEQSPDAVCPPACRRACAYVLAHTASTPDESATLIALAADADPRTRAHAVTGLRRLGGDDAQQALTSLLDDPRHEIQQKALVALLEEARPLLPPAAAMVRRVADEQRPHLRPLFDSWAPEQSGTPPAGPGQSQATFEEPTNPEREALPSALSLSVHGAVLPRANLLALVVPGLEGIAAAEIAGLEGSQETARGRGCILFSWAGPLARLHTLRTVEDILLDGGPLLGHTGDTEGATLARSLAIWAGLRVASTAHAYIRVGRTLPGRAMLRTQASAALARHGIVTTGHPATLPTPLVVDVIVRLEQATAPATRTSDNASSVPRLGLRLTPFPLGRRPLPGGDVPASLKATVAAAMVRLLLPPGGDVFLDPMCGAGTLLRERANLAPPPALLLGGDSDPRAVRGTQITLAGQVASVAAWDARALPLDDGSVDLAATNPPYGRRTGSHRQNQELYPRLLSELHRVMRRGGHAALITAEKSLLERALSGRQWQVHGRHPLDAGGLLPTIYLVERR